MRFEDLRLAEPLLRAIRTAGYRTPTPIQSSAIPHVLAGRDVLGCAQTGTGKTAAFALPILQHVGARPRTGAPTAPLALILCPTRELAQQIHESFCTYGQHLDVRQAVAYGGVSLSSQARAIKAGVDILVATPGRLLDLLEQRHVSLSSVEILVLDEADRMLDMGFLPVVRRVLRQLPRRHQTLLFSATMPTAIRKLAADLLHDPALVQHAPESPAAATVAHWVYHVEQPDKLRLLTGLLARAPRKRTLVFTRTKHGADRLARHLLQAGIRAAAFHGNKTQRDRTRVLAAFRAARTPVLVATDIAARGLDVDDIGQVFNYDLTPDPETYIHRVGRTGRAGAAGTAVSFCSTQERENLHDIERRLRQPLQPAAVPPRSPAPVRATTARTDGLQHALAR